MNVPGNPQLEAVSGFDDPLELIAVGHDAVGTPIWIFDPTTNGWSRETAGGVSSRNLFAVATVDDGVSRRLYVGGDDGRLYQSTDGADFVAFPSPFPTTDFIRSIAVNPAKTKLYVAADGNRWARFDIAVKTWEGPYTWPYGLSSFVGGAAGIEVMGVGGGANSAAAVLLTIASTNPSELPRPGAAPWPNLRGGWIGVDGSNMPRLFVAAEPATILAWSNTGTPYASEAFSDVNLRIPWAIGGRWNPVTNAFDVYAVGEFGPVITKRMNGTWNNITVPGSQARYGIWVSAAGDVVTIGSNGETTLFY